MAGPTWFARHYDRLMRPLEKGKFVPIRAGLIGLAEGCVLEIGCGTGINFPLYRACDVTAIEPDDTMRGTAEQRASQARVPIRVLKGDAEALAFAEDAFDCIVGTLVFCTIPNPIRAIREMKRVCKPGGRILLFEHVRHEHPVLAGLQDVLNPLWKRLCDGCHLNRDTLHLLEAEGIEIRRSTMYMNRIFVAIEAVNGKEGGPP